MRKEVWTPSKEELEAIEQFAYHGFRNPEDLAAMLEITLQQMYECVWCDEEDKLWNAYVRGWARGKEDLQARHMGIAMGKVEATETELKALTYILQTKYGHDPNLAASKVRRELKEAELKYNRNRDRRNNYLAEKTYTLQKDRFEFSKSEMLLKLAEKTGLSKDELVEMARSAGLE